MCPYMVKAEPLGRHSWVGCSATDCARLQNANPALAHGAEMLGGLGSTSL